MPRTKQTPKKQNDEHAERVKFVVDRFNSSWTYAQTNYHSRWENSWKLYNNRRTKRNYEGVSDVFVPMTFSTIETIVAALAGSKPTFDFLPPQDQAEQPTEILNALLDYYWDKDQWNIKVQSLVRSMLIYGTGVAYLQWYIDHPVMVNVPVRDFFFNPNATNIENCDESFYAGRRYLTTLDDLKSFEVVDTDPESKTYGQMVKKYKNLDAISEGSGAKDGDETDKAKKELFYGSTAPDPEHTQVEVLELWTEEKVISVVNRSVLIQDDENPYLAQSRERYGEDKAKGIIPFIIARDYVDESLFYARGEVEVIADLQEDLNDLTNQKRDYFTYLLNPMWNLNPNKADMIEQISAAPGVVFPLDPNDLTPVAMPVFPSAAFNEEVGIENKIREATAVDQVVKGVTQSTSTTATEVNAQIASAGQRLGMKITQLENEAFHRLARIVLSFVKLYVTSPQQVRVVTDRARWELFNPQDFQGEYEPHVKLSSSVEAKKNQDVRVAQEMFLALSADPTVNQEELKRIVLPKMFDLDTDEVDRLLTQAQPEMGMGEMPMDPEMGMEPPMGDFYEDPVTGELLPQEPTEPTEEELLMIEAGL